MSTRSRFVSWLGPLSYRWPHNWSYRWSCCAALACALAAPSVASAAPKGKRGDTSSKKDDASEQATDEESASESEEDAGSSDDGGDAEASASVSGSGVTASAGGKKGAPMKGRFGFGAMRTVSGLNALYGRYYLGNRFTLGLGAGFATFSHRDTDDNGEFNRTRTVGAFAVGPEAFFWPVQGKRDQQVHADFGIGVRALTYVGFLGLTEQERSETLDTPVEIDVEIPAKILLFIGPRVSVNPEFGVVIRVIPGSREPDGNGDSDQNPGTGIGERLGTSNGPGLGFEVGNHAGFFMGIGVGYWFGKLRQ